MSPEKTVIEFTELTPKKHSVRVDTTDDDSPVSNLYVARWWMAASGATGGVRVTIEPIAD